MTVETWRAWEERRWLVAAAVMQEWRLGQQERTLTKADENGVTACWTAEGCQGVALDDYSLQIAGDWMAGICLRPERQGL